MEALNVSYVTTGHEGIASFRYRIAAPVRELQKHMILPEVSTKANKKANIAVFSKHWTYNDASYANFCRIRGQKVVYDICDDHFEGRMREHYLRMVDAADLITVNSSTMQERVLKCTGRESVIIEDPVLSPHGRYDPNKVGALIWYGQVQNLQGMYDVYPEGCGIPLVVAMPQQMTQPPPKMIAECIQYVPWHKDIIPELAGGAIAAILPYRQGKPAKSANRVLEALWSGIPVLTDPLPAVAHLAHGIRYLTSDFNSDIQNILANDMTREMQYAQDYIQEKYSPEVIGGQWANVFRSLV